MGIEKPKAIIIDVDGTIAHNNGHRKPYDWHKVNHDEPKTDVINFIKWIIAPSQASIIYVSGRMEDCREATARWIWDHLGVPDEGLFMRKSGDYRSDNIVKEEIYRTEIEPYWNVVCVIDDRNKVVKMWRDLGLVCLQVADGDF